MVVAPAEPHGERLGVGDEGAHDEGLPSWPFGTGAGKLFSTQLFKDWGYSTWVPVLMPYVKNDKIFSCPNGPTTGNSM